MDPVSITASFITLLGAATKTAATLERLWHLRDAPNIVQSIMNEITELRALSQILDSLMQDIQADEPVLQDALAVSQRSADVAIKKLDELDVFLRNNFLRSSELTHKGKPKISRTAWLQHQDRLENLRGSLRDVRQSLSLTFSVFNSTSAAQIRPLLLQVLDISIVNHEHLSILEEKALKSDDPYTTIQSKLDRVINGIQDLSRAHQGQNDYSERGSLSDLNLISSSRSTTPKSGDIVCINTALVPSRCSNFCRCSCHSHVQTKTPRALREIVGSLFYSYTGTPMFGRRQCDFPLCQRTKYGTLRLSYLFPRWAIARAICITGSWRDLSGVGASWTIRMPRLVDWGPIWSAVEHGDQEKMLQLFKEGRASSFDIHGGDGRSLLHHAIWYKRFHMCYQIALEGADWGHRDVDGSSPADVLWPSILTGVGYHDPALLQLKDLLERDYDFDNMGFNSLHMIVVQLSKVPLAEQLMHDYVEINRPDAHGRTALMWAAMRDDPSQIEILLRWKADVHVMDHEGLTALHYAARQGACKCAELLLEAGCEPDIEDFAGRTPLIDFCFHSRAQIDQIPLFRLLVKWGANVHHQSRRRHWTCLHMAAAAGNTDVLQALLSMSTDIDARNKDGNTPIMMALSENRLDAVLILLKQGARLDFYDKFGRGALILVARYGNVAIMEVLTTMQICGIDVEAPDQDGNTARDHFEKFRSRDFDEEKPDTGEDRDAFLALLASINIHKIKIGSTYVSEVGMGKEISRPGIMMSFKDEICIEIDNDDAVSFTTESSASNLLFKSCILMDEDDNDSVDLFVDASSRIDSELKEVKY